MIFRSIGRIRSASAARRAGLLLSAVVVSLLSVGAIAADTGPSLDRERPTLRLWHIPLEHDYNPFSKANRGVFDYYRKTHPEVRLVPTTQITIGGDVLEAQFLMAMAGGTAPDVISNVPVRTFRGYLEKGFFHPLDEFLSQGEIDRLNPELLKVLSRDGKIYGLPIEDYAHCLFYRRADFAAVGLDPRRPPRTWDELYEYAKRLTRPEEGKYGFGLVTGWAYGWFWTNFLWQAGGEPVRQRRDGQWEATYDSPEAVTATEFFCRKMASEPWERDGTPYRGVVYKEPDGGKIIEDFGRGIVSMMIAVPNSANLFALQKQWSMAASEIGLAPLPRGPAGEATILGANMAAVNASISDPAVRRAAADYVRYLCGDEGQRVNTRLLVENGVGDFVRPEFLRRYGHLDVLSRMNPEWVETQDRLLDHARIEPFCPGYQNVQTLALAEALDTITYDENADVKTVLSESVRTVTRDIFDTKPPEEVNRRRKTARIVFVAVLLVIGVLVVRMFRQMVQVVRSDDTTGVAGGARTHAIAWLFMLPALLSILVWGYLPLVRGSFMAFQDYQIMTGTTWVGLDNFIEVFGRPVFWQSVRNTVVYVGLSLGIGFFIPIILAILLTEVPKGKLIYRTIYYLPAATSALVIMFLWRWFYQPSPQGLLNTLLGVIGADPREWLGDPNLAMLCVIVPAIWAGAGPGSLIYQAALKSVPESQYEAADIDGAGILRKTWNVTLPTIKPLIIINFIGAFIGAFHAMQNIFVMTGGGPARATYTLGMEIFFNAYLFLNFGYATAVAWILGSLLIGFTMYQLRILRNIQFTAAGSVAGVRE